MTLMIKGIFPYDSTPSCSCAWSYSGVFMIRSAAMRFSDFMKVFFCDVSKQDHGGVLMWQRTVLTTVGDQRGSNTDNKGFSFSHMKP
jgi:hypothetical protein